MVIKLCYFFFQVDSGKTGEEVEDISDLVESKARDFAANYEDFEVLSLFWEARFFSPQFANQKKAEEFLESNPKLSRNLNFDRMIARANRVAGEDYLFRKIVEIAMKFDLEVE